MILRHSKLQIQYRGEFAGMREMRKHVAWYTKGLTGAADLRRRVNETETLDELMNVIGRTMKSAQKYPLICEAAR